MDNKRYQYHVFNQHFSFVITSVLKNEEYVIMLAKRVAKDYYEFQDGQLEDVKTNFITEFYKESVINLDILSNQF